MSLAFKGTRSAAVPMAADAVIEVGDGICIDTATGFAVPPSVSTTLKTIGNNLHRKADNTGGANGDKDVVAYRGNGAEGFPYANSSAGDLIAKKDIGEPCYWAGPQQVALTNGGSTRSAAGIIANVEDDGTVIVVHPVQAL